MIRIREDMAVLVDLLLNERVDFDALTGLDSLILDKYDKSK